MHSCCVPCCYVRSSKKMYCFPTPKSKLHLFEIWLKRIDSCDLAELDYNVIYNSKRVCFKHFDPFCSVQDSKILKKGSLPTLNLPSFAEESFENCNIQFMKNATNVEEINEETGIKVDVSVIEVEDTTQIDPLQQETYEELLDKYVSLNNNFNDYRLKTEKEINLILGYVTYERKNHTYECPKCEYECTSVNEIKVHLLAHAEKRVCYDCFKIFGSQFGLIIHSKFHQLKRNNIILLKNKRS